MPGLNGRIPPGIAKGYLETREFESNLSRTGLLTVRLLPTIRRPQTRTVLRPHGVDKGVSGTTFGIIVFFAGPELYPGGFISDAIQLGLVLVHPAVHIVEEGVVISCFSQAHQADRESFATQTLLAQERL